MTFIPPEKPLVWSNIVFFGLYHLAFFALTPVYFMYYPFSWVALGIMFGVVILCGLTVTAGYHRLFSHRTYQTVGFVEMVFLFLGCLGITSSVASWAQSHRIHHAKVDSLEDPYSIKRGFWYAHLLWLFYESDPVSADKIPDLMANKWIRWQHRYYGFLVVITNVLFYIAAGLLTDWMSALYLCILMRIMIVHHGMFAINSVAHTWGERTYSRELTAVDNWIMAFITFGEGYHNYHHAFPNDYRNGIAWYHYDPTKWLIWILEKLHLAKNLRSKDGLAIRANLMQKDFKMVLHTLSEKLPDLHVREKITAGFERIKGDFEKKVNDLHSELQVYGTLLADKKSRALIRLKKLECLGIQRELKHSWKLWKEMIHEFDHNFSIVEHAH